MSGLDADALRQMVREVLREVLPRATAADAPGPAAVAPDVRRVRVRDDRDLADLVGRVLDLADDPARAADLRAGRIRFVLDRADDGANDRAVGGGGVPVTPRDRDTTPLDVERGAVTERLVHRAAREGRSLRVGPHAVITPLARDRARALGVSIERATVPSDPRSPNRRETR